MDIDTAIAQSITTDTIVHLAWSAERADALMGDVSLEDSADNGSVLEAWGSLGPAGAWRVHLHRAQA